MSDYSHKTAIFVYNLQMNKSKTSGFIRHVILGYAEQQNAEVLHPELFHLGVNFSIMHLVRYPEQPGDCCHDAAAKPGSFCLTLVVLMTFRMSYVLLFFYVLHYLSHQLD